MATLDEIRAEVLETAGLASDDSRFADATMTRIVNRGLRALSAEHDWPWNEASETINTVDGTLAYSPAAAWSKTLRLRYDDVDLFEYQSSDATRFVNISGAPVGYYIEEEQIHFVPTPDDAYAVEHVYSAYETALSGDSDTPALPDRYIDWLVSICLVQVAQRIRDDQLYSMADRERRKWLVRAHDERRRSTSSVKVKTRSDWSI